MKQKNVFPYIMVAVSLVIIIMLVVYVIGNNSEQSANGSGNTAGVESGNSVDTDTTVASTIEGTEVPEEIVNKVEEIKEHIMANGFEDEDGMYYIGYMYGQTMYCSIRYDKESDMLCAQNSYYTQSVDGEYLEVLSVLDNFPYLSSVEYYEDYYESIEDDENKANTAGAFVAIAGFKPAEFTAESELNFYEMETSTYEYDDLDSALNIAGQYSVMSFSMWDEVLELEFGYNLKDFGFSNFVRKEYKSDSAE